MSREQQQSRNETMYDRWLINKIVEMICPGILPTVVNAVVIRHLDFIHYRQKFLKQNEKNSLSDFATTLDLIIALKVCLYISTLFLPYFYLISALFISYLYTGI